MTILPVTSQPLTQRNISNSEVTSWLSCRQQYYFAHYLNIEPIVTSVPLFRGSLGHEAFQRYAEARIEGKSHDAAQAFSEDVFMVALKASPDKMDTILQTKMIYMKYQAFHKGWPEWKLLSVEQKFDLPLTPDMKITIRFDVMVEELKTSRILLGDYKFSYDFWSIDDHALNGQMPKYISVMNANGHKIDGGFLEEIRTRPLSAANSNDASKLWKRSFYYPSIAKKSNTMRQHIAAGFEILDYWNADDKTRESKSIPVLNKHGACKFCNFKELCASKLDGGDITYAIETGFKQNSYGYNDTSTETQGEL